MTNTVLANIDISPAYPYLESFAKGLAVLVIGLIIAKIVTKICVKVLKKSFDDPSLTSFLGSVTGMVLKICVVLAAANTMGVEMASFTVILGSAGLAVGMALSGTLQNFAGGVMILIFKPFKIGDVIEAQGYTGSVKEIQIFQTLLTTPDNKLIIIPNGPLSNGSLTNFSAMDKRRVDHVFGIGYDDNIDQAREVISKLIDADSRVLKAEGVTIVVGELADSSVNFTVRYWVEPGDYWGSYFDMIENVKKTFDLEKISIPYPQMDVHQK